MAKEYVVEVLEEGAEEWFISSNHLNDRGIFPNRDDAEEWAEMVEMDYDGAGYEVIVRVSQFGN